MLAWLLIIISSSNMCWSDTSTSKIVRSFNALIKNDFSIILLYTKFISFFFQEFDFGDFQRHIVRSPHPVARRCERGHHDTQWS